MRPLEIAIPALLAFYLLWTHPRPRWVRLSPLAAFVLMLIHLAVEGYRWQMIPLYSMTVLLALSASLRLRSNGDWKPLASVLTVVPLALSTALPVLLPVPSIPRPGGPYPVGTRRYELTDTSRQEIYSVNVESCPGEQCQGPRRFQIQVWYPAAIGPTDEHAPWMPRADIFAPAIATYLHLPAFFLDHLALVRTPAYQETDVAPADERYPLVLFSHGWNGFNAQNTGQAIELASHGYVVVGVQHPYGAIITVFDDGTIAPNNPSALPDGAPDAEYEAAAQRLVAQWSGDLAYALDFMESQAGDPGSPFYTALDLSHVGAYGHSTGGGAAIQFCGTDRRCKALLGMDPFMRPVSPEVLEHGVSQPAFFMFSQRWADDVDSRNNELFHPFILHAPESLGVISIQGTAHYDFSDLPLLSPLAPWLGLKGPISGKRVTSIINEYLLSFFELTLRGIRVPLFDGQNQKYNEVIFSR